jgi:2-C-methyl-D-erythritol 4-phosphate cytidylyltransferase
MYITAIIVAAGKGKRFKSDISKPLVKLDGRPMLYYSLRVFSRVAAVKNIIVVANRGNKAAIIRLVRAAGFDKVSAIVEGGARRQDSVRNGLKRICARTDFILVHDAARPLISPALVQSVIRAAASVGAAVAAVPVKATIKESRRDRSQRPAVARTLDRSKLWEVQTPQVFRKALLLDAYSRFGDASVTDDASLVEKNRAPVALAPGAYSNIKITTPEDAAIARALLQTR